MIKNILVTILIAVAMLGIAMTPAFGATKKEQDKVIKEAVTLCKIYLKQCTVHIVKYEGLGAQTRYGGDIYITNSLVEKLTEPQMRSVLFHEVGHVVLEHIEKTAQYQQSCEYYKTCNSEALSTVHRNYEYEADRFAVLVTKFTGKPEGLEGALVIITPKDMFNTTHATHPSTADRIQRIRKLYYGKVK